METDTEITVNESDDPAPSICRCCLADGCYKDISAEYFWMGKREVYADMLNEAFNITIPYSKSGDSHSNARLICEQCITRLRDAADFKQQIIQSEKTFNEHLDTTLSEISMELELVEDEKPLVKKEKKDIDESDDAIDFPDFSPDNNDDDDNEDDADNMPLMKIASKTPKQESIETITIKSTTSPKVVKKRPVTSSLVPPPIKRLKLPTTSKEPARNIVTIKKVVGAPLNQKTQQSLFVRKVMGKPPPTLTKMSRTLPGPSTKILGRLPSNAKKLIKQGTSINVVRQIVGGGKTIMRQAGGTQLVIKPQAPKKVSASTEKPSTSDAKAPVKKVVTTRNPARKNALILLKNSTAYPMQVSRAKDLIKCYFCDLTFADPNYFRYHMDYEHPNVNARLTVKPKGHALIRVDIKFLRCRLCKIRCQNLNTLASHLKEKHRLGVDLDYSLNLLPFKLEKEAFNCAVCGTAFRSLRGLVRHTVWHSKHILCETCGRTFRSQHLLEDHVLKNHSGSKYVCGKCYMQFPSDKAKKEHITANINCMMFHCKICNKGFRTYDQKKDHDEDIHGFPRRVYNCEKCGKGFRRRMNKYIHYKAEHTEDFKCALCDKTFGMRRDLKEHICRVHTGERPYKCTDCDKAFTDKQGLKKHLPVHDDSKKSACHVCQSLFVSPRNLKHHIQKHHPIPSFLTSSQDQ